MLTQVDRACIVHNQEVPTFPQFTQLPQDTQGLIVTWISDPRDAYRLFITCRLAYTTLQEYFLANETGAAWVVQATLNATWGHFDKATCRIQRRIACMLNSGDIRFQKLFSELLRQVSYRGKCISMRDPWLSTVALAGGKHLKDINFSGLEKIPKNSLITIAEQCANLETLTITPGQCGTDWAHAMLARCGKTLVTLKIYGSQVSDAILASISQCTHLKNLDLSGCMGISSKGISAIAKGCGTTLRKLKLNVTDVTDDGLIAIAQHAHGIEKLDLSYCGQITDASLGHVMESCTALKSLFLSSCPQLSGTCFASLAKHDVALERVLLRNCPDMPATNLKIMAERCKNLLACTLGPVSDPSDVLATIVKCATGLKILDIKNSHVTDLDLAVIAGGATKLEQLCLNHCSQVTDGGVYNLARGCKNLVNIDLSHTGISDAGLIGLVTKNTGLTVLGAIGCNITDEALRFLMPRCSDLEEVYLSRTSITDAGLDIIATHGKKLKKLGTLGCRSITDLGFKRFRERLPGVQLF